MFSAGVLTLATSTVTLSHVEFYSDLGVVVTLVADVGTSSCGQSEG